MECPKCRTNNPDDTNTCKACGNALYVKSVVQDKIISEQVSNEQLSTDQQSGQPKKNYGKIFWTWFGVLVALEFFSSFITIFEEGGASEDMLSILWLIWLVAIIIIVVLFVQTTHKALKEVGKNWGWAVGLLVLVPYGFWIPFLVIRSMLKPKGLWVVKHKSFKLTKKDKKTL